MPQNNQQQYIERSATIVSAGQQIFIKHGKNCFVEITSDGFPLKLVKFTFVSYDPALSESKTKAKIIYYLSFADALALCNKIKSPNFEHHVLVDYYTNRLRDLAGIVSTSTMPNKDKMVASIVSAVESGNKTKMKKLIEKLKTEGVSEKRYYDGTVFVRYAGTSANTLKKQGKARPDGKPLSRQLRVKDGDRSCVFQAESGPGKEEGAGAIVPDGKPEQTVMVGFKQEELDQMACIIEAHVNAYIGAMYNKVSVDSVFKAVQDVLTTVSSGIKKDVESLYSRLKNPQAKNVSVVKEMPEKVEASEIAAAPAVDNDDKWANEESDDLPF